MDEWEQMFENFKLRPLAELALSNRIHNILIAYGIKPAGDLLKKSKGELLGMRGIGKESVWEIEVRLGCHSLRED
jgi:DNA-directed RNA polymerase alpha subunit